MRNGKLYIITILCRSSNSLLNIDVLFGLDNCFIFTHGTAIRRKSNEPIVHCEIISCPCSMDNERNICNVGNHFRFVIRSIFSSNAVEKESFGIYSKLCNIESVGVKKK